MTWVIAGASAGLGRALAEEFATHGATLLLVASDARDLEPLARDLALRFGTRVATVAHDAIDPSGLADAVESALGEEPLDGLLLPIGQSLDADQGALDAARSERLVAVNFVAPCLLASRFLPRLVAQGRGSLVGFGSVAAVRGRSCNVVYAAAKRALESAFESYRHRAEKHGVTVTFYVLGYLDTSLAYGKRLALPKAQPGAVARAVWKGRASARGRRFLPRFWAPIALVLRLLPWRIFRRLDF